MIIKKPNFNLSNYNHIIRYFKYDNKLYIELKNSEDLNFFNFVILKKMEIQSYITLKNKKFNLLKGLNEINFEINNNKQLDIHYFNCYNCKIEDLKKVYNKILFIDIQNIIKI